jgi:hypothetical protein
VPSAAVAPLAKADAAAGFGSLDESGVSATASTQVEEEHISATCLIRLDACEPILHEGVERGHASVRPKANATRVKRFFH